MDKKPYTALEKHRLLLENLSEGRVTGLKRQRSADRLSVYLDNRFAFGMSTSLLEKYPVPMGTTLSTDLQRKILEDDFQRKARNVAFNYLSFKSRTESELRKRLNKYSGGASFVNGIVEECKGLGLVNDAEYARVFVISRHRSKGHGPRRLTADLLKRGVNRSLIDAALHQLEDENVQESASLLLHKKWKSYRNVPPEKRRQRAISFLLRRGYDYSAAKLAYEAVTNTEIEQDR